MGWVGIDQDYPVSIKEVLDITAETGALTTQSRIRELKPYRSRFEVTDKDAHWAEIVLSLIHDVGYPMLMYQAEKDVVDKALKMLLDEWEFKKNKRTKDNPVGERSCT